MIKYWYDQFQQKHSFQWKMEDTLGISFSTEYLQKYADTNEAVANHVATELMQEIRQKIKEEIMLVLADQPDFVKPDVADWIDYFKNPNPSYTPGPKIVDELAAKFPGLLEPDVRCPACGTMVVSLAVLIIHLNDSERWTREQIADWLEESDYNIQLKE